MTKKYIKPDINNINTWAYPNIPSGVTVIRKEAITENEIYKIYKDCIEIQRYAYISLLKTNKNRIKY
ncbi:MAG: hypothetical protein FWF92_11710 [Oscillospiraceae bacterium]|nr:hypothetical protein [Oscillospiraceae bacterium]